MLDELPETLDGTYERTLLGINRQTWGYARRLFQCIAISIRPLHVEELAELFAVLPDLETTPGFNIGWRPEDPEEFILSTCSTLVAIVDVEGEKEKVVQFTHFSVREYLTSDRIANSASASHFHILPKPAHTLLARACLGVLLQLDDSTQADEDKIIQNFPLALYAGKNWVNHAQFEDVSSDIQDEMDCLFDRNKPHWAAWHWLYDIEERWIRYPLSHRTAQHDVVPLYYAALCGFRDLAERLLNAHPKDVNSLGGYRKTPLYAALDKGHLNIAMLLLERGADVEIRGCRGQTAIYMSSSRGYAELVRLLIDRGVDLNVVCRDDDPCWNINNVRRTPLLGALQNGRLEIARMLLKHGADVDYPDNILRPPLHIASCHQSNDLARLLLDYGVNPNASDTCGKTALHEASSRGHNTVVMLLLEYGANVDARSVFEWTPLHCAARRGRQEVVRLLLDHGADANAQKDDRWMALHEAACHGHLQVVEVLLKHGADPRARTCGGMTPFQLASKRNFTQVMRLLSERTGE